MTDSKKKTSDRQHEREQEDVDYQPVIVKRTDQALRHPDDTLENAVKEGELQHERKPFSLFLSAFAAGLIIGVTVLSVAFANALTQNLENPYLQRLIIAFFYPVGFIICIMGGTQLFTEQTAMAVYPVLDGKASLSSLIRLLILVLLGNLLGALASSFMITSFSTMDSGMVNGFIHAGEKFFQHPLSHILWSSVLAGWLMALGGWLILAMPYSSSQLISIFIVTFVIGIGGLHHSIAGGGELFAYFFLVDAPQWSGSLTALALSVVGNIVGGSVFVALLNYGQIREYNKD